MASDLVVYGVKGSPFVRKVVVSLAEKSIDFEIEPVSIFPPPDWFAEISPLKRIPVLRDRSVGTEGREGTIPDSSAICAYIERRHPAPPLYPTEPFDHARALWLEEYADTELAAQIGGGVFRPVVLARVMGNEADLETARRTLREKLPPLFDYLEGELGDDFFVGGALSIADVAVATQLVNLQHAGGRVDGERWPKLAAHAERVHSRPSFARCIEDERRLLKVEDTAL